MPDPADDLLFTCNDQDPQLFWSFLRLKQTDKGSFSLANLATSYPPQDAPAKHTWNALLLAQAKAIQDNFIEKLRAGVDQGLASSLPLDLKVSTLTEDEWPLD
jgi:hypothetical protein